MRYGILAISAAALLTIGHTATANPSAQQQVPQPQAQAAPVADVTEAHLETFADIYVDMQALEQELSQSVAEAQSQEDAQRIHQTAEEKMIGVIREHGWSVDEYNTVAEAINSSPELRMQAVAMINERS